METGRRRPEQHDPLSQRIGHHTPNMRHGGGVAGWRTIHKAPVNVIVSFNSVPDWPPGRGRRG